MTVNFSTGARAALLMAGSCATLSMTLTARAEDTPIDMGKPGTLVIGGALMGGRHSSTPTPGSEQSSSSVTASITGDLFVARNVSLGVGIGGGYSTFTYRTTELGESSNHQAAVGAALRLGYYIPISNRVGLWPVVSAGLTYAKTTGTIAEGTGSTKEIDLLAQVIFHVDEHWFLRLQPGLVAYSSSTGFGGGLAPVFGGGFGAHF